MQLHAVDYRWLSALIFRSKRHKPIQISTENGGCDEFTTGDEKCIGDHAHIDFFCHWIFVISSASGIVIRTTFSWYQKLWRSRSTSSPRAAGLVAMPSFNFTLKSFPCKFTLRKALVRLLLHHQKTIAHSVVYESYIHLQYRSHLLLSRTAPLKRIAEGL